MTQETISGGPLVIVRCADPLRRNRASQSTRPVNCIAMKSVMIQRIVIDNPVYRSKKKVYEKSTRYTNCKMAASRYANRFPTTRRRYETTRMIETTEQIMKAR